MVAFWFLKEKEVYIRDTVFVTNASSVSTSLPITDPHFKSAFKALSKTFKNATVSAKIVGDSLQIDCKCDTLFIKAQLRDTYEKEYHSRQRDSLLNEFRATSEKENKTILEKHVPGWVKFFAWSGGALWLGVLLSVIFTLIHVFKK